MNACAVFDSHTKHKIQLENRARQIQRLLVNFKTFGTWPALVRYTIAALFVTVSFFICRILEGASNYPFFLFIPSIILTSLFFDRKTGYFAVLLSSSVVFYFIIPIENPFSSLETGKIVTLIAFIVVGLFTAYIIEVMRITIDILAEATAIKEDKKKLERELFHAQKMESVGLAMSTLAHDFKNILMPVSGIAELLKRRLTHQDAGTLELLKVLENVHHNGNKLVDDINAFGRKDHADCILTNLNGTLEKNLTTLRQGVKETIALDLKAGENVPEIVIDPALLYRALSNIIDNAQDAMPDGGKITIETSLAELTGADYCVTGRCAIGKYVCLAVRDTGTGISKDVKTKMFEPFFTTKPCGQGTGLGMAMVADFVRLAQGCITVDSSLGCGTTIKMFFPYSASKEEGTSAKSSESTY